MILPATPTERLRHLESLALKAGADRIGVTGADPFTDTRDTIERRKRDDLHGGLTFTFNHPERATDVRVSFPWAERLFAVGRTYLPEAGSPDPDRPGTARIARFAVDDFYGPLREPLEVVAGSLRDAGFRAEVLVDDNRLVDRAAAVRAGVGWWGKNTMVLAPGQGPWMLLGSVVTDADIAVTSPMTRDCGTCSACIPACPTGALVAPGVLDARRCLAALAQLPGAIPEEFRDAMGDRLYGCDDCLDACPPGVRLLQRSGEHRGQVDIAWVLNAEDDELLEAFDRFYLPRRRPGVLRRNALVAAGNSGRRDLIEVVRPYTEHEDPILVEHARWAFERLTP